MALDPSLYVNRELSWLAFNERVLHEAFDERNPLLERLKFLAISSTNGKFGGLRASDSSFFATNGLTGVYAPGVQFQGPVFIGNINAFATATPVIMIGSSPDTRITGGDLSQPNGQPVKVSGLTQLKFTAGSDSNGNLLVLKANAATLRQNGVDVTAQLVVYTQ